MNLLTLASRAVVLLGLCLSALIPLSAQLTLQTSAQGSFEFNAGYPLTPALHQSSLSSLYRASPDSAERTTTAGYVIFQRPDFASAVVAATLTLDYSGAFVTGSSSSAIGVGAWDVTTPLEELTAGPFDVPISSAAAFDLQGGTLYGSSSVEPGVFQMKTASLSLGSTFLDQMNTSLPGSGFAVGLAVNDVADSLERSIQLLTAQAGDAHVQLRLEFAEGGFTPVPEVSTYSIVALLMIAGLIARRTKAGRVTADYTD